MVGSDAAGGPSVTVAQGTLRGFSSGGVHAFLGVPYALPPFGERRFGAPVPVPPGDDVRDCLAYGHTPPKAPYPSPIDEILAEETIEGEDILNLNVWTPELGDARLPVLVWIHGGAFVNGSGAVATYDGSRFARDGVVCVTINYRLGPDGFLFLDGAPPNRGLLDQIAALEWVRDNIAAFGGDPDKVTIAGESAGAMSATTLLASPRAEGLFRAVISQSGAGNHVHSAAVGRKVMEGLAEHLKIAPTREAFAAVPNVDLYTAQFHFSRYIAAHRDVPRWEELTVNSMPFEPTIDGDLVPGVPLERIRAGAGADVALLTGTNKDEMTLFLVPTGLIGVMNEPMFFGLATMYQLPPKGTQVYRDARPDAQAGLLFIEVATDWFFRIPALRVAEARADGPAPSYVYQFDWETPSWNGRLGATHALEVPFVFDALDAPGVAPLVGPEPPQALADEMHRAWVQFVTSGDPGWPVYGPERAVMRFDAQSELVKDPDSGRRRVWEGLR